MSRIILIILAAIVFHLPMWADARDTKVYAASEVPNVKLADRNSFVSDPEHYLTGPATESINRKLHTLMDSTTVETAVIVVPSIGDADLADYAQQIGDNWGIGRKDNSNGLLIVVAVSDRMARIHTGYGLEGVLPDALCGRLITNNLAPWMKKGLVSGGVENLVDAICNVLEQPAAVAEIKSGEHERHPGEISGDVFHRNSQLLLNMLLGVVVLMFCGGIWQLVRTAHASRRIKNYNYGKAMTWRNALPRMAWWCILSAGAALPLLLICYLTYRYWRTRRLRCEHCNTMMHRLPEDKDNEYLTSGEDCEEQLGTVDYDVWLCPKCDNMKKYPFIKNQNYYKECPHCHHIAYGMKYDHTVVPATVHKEGVGEKIYECRHCGHNDRTRYRIPKKPDPAAIAATAIVAGGVGRSRGGGFGGGGGFSGGSWGGGSFGGGGATGRW